MGNDIRDIRQDCGCQCMVFGRNFSTVGLRFHCRLSVGHTITSMSGSRSDLGQAVRRFEQVNSITFQRWGIANPSTERRKVGLVRAEPSATVY